VVCVCGVCCVCVVCVVCVLCGVCVCGVCGVCGVCCVVCVTLKCIFKKYGGGMDWINLAQDRSKYLAVVKVVMNTNKVHLKNCTSS